MYRLIFISPRTGKLRSGWQVGYFFGSFLLCYIVVLIILDSLKDMALSTYGKPIVLADNIKWLCVFTYSKTVQLIVALMVSMLAVTQLSERKIASLGYSRHKGWIKDLLAGISIGFIMIGVITLVLSLFKSATLVRQTSPASNSLIGISLTVLIILIAASLEEVLFRGFALQALAENLSPLTAALIMSVPFGLLHLGNPAASTFSLINTILAGVWLSLSYFKTRSLWLVTGLHFSWNLSMGTIFGFPVSGITELSTYAPFRALDNGPNWWTGGSYGPEGGAIVTLILIVGTIAIIKASKLSISPEMAKYFTNISQTNS